MRCSQNTMNKKQAIKIYLVKKNKLLDDNSKIARYYAKKCEEHIKRIQGIKQ